MKRLIFLLAVLLAPLVGGATEVTWVNTGFITATPPQVDAINFVNYGTFGSLASPIVTVEPYRTSSTLNFTNATKAPGAGLMVGSPGWEFDWEPVSAGVPRPAASFHNAGRIEALDARISTVIIGAPYASLYRPSKLFVSATNIVNRGALSVGPNGWLRLEGANLDLSRSTLEVNPVMDDAAGSFNNSPTNGYYVPDVGISDVWWGQSNMNFNCSFLWDGSVAQTPLHDVDFPGGSFRGSFSLGNPYADSYVTSEGEFTLILTNELGGTSEATLMSNVWKQAVFVSAPADMTVQMGFTPGTIPTNLFRTVGVLLSVSASNAVTTLPETATIYVSDHLASLPGRGLLENVIDPAMFRPTNYIVSRVNQGVGAAYDSYPPPDFFLSAGQSDPNVTRDAVTNSRVTGEYAAYSAKYNNLVSEFVPSGSVGSLPGRSHVHAKTLNLDWTRIRGEGQIVISTPHLISSSNAVIDCENLSFNLGSTNGSLKVENLSKSSVARLRGNIYVWSAVWANPALVLITNNYQVYFDTNGVVTNATQLTLTNYITVQYHTLMLNAEAVETVLPVSVFDFATHSTNVVVNDNLRIVQSFLTDAQSFTINGEMALSSVTLENAFGPARTFAVSDWIHTNAPNLLYFTNNGTLSVLDELHLGDDRNVPYANIINTGDINANSISWDSVNFQSGGSLDSQGPMLLKGGTGKFENGSSTAAGVVSFQANDLKFYDHQLTANGALYFEVTNSLADGGPASSNFFQCSEGFNLLTKPSSGDLLGTTLHDLATTEITPSPLVTHVWAGEDRGDNKSGYSNNVALGRLILSAPAAENPLFSFSGSGGQNGLYVDLLDLSQLLDYQNELQIDPNLVIYYAAAKLAFTPPPTNGVPQLPEEYLNGQFGGRLRWVKSFAGPNSSVDVVVNGNQTAKVNKALRNSAAIDSDSDGVANVYDGSPFDGVQIDNIARNPSPAGYLLSWDAAANTVYRVEYRTNLVAGGWQLLLTTTNTASVATNLTVLDTNAVSGRAQRYYRVTYAP